MLLLSMDTPTKFNLHKTLPRISYKYITYVRSIYLECLMGYFANEDYPSGIYLLKVTFYTWWKHQKTSWKHRKTSDAFWVHRNETLAWIRLKTKLNKYAFEYMKVSNISFSEEWQRILANKMYCEHYKKWIYYLFRANYILGCEIESFKKEKLQKLYLLNTCGNAKGKQKYLFDFCLSLAY